MFVSYQLQHLPCGAFHVQVTPANILRLAKFIHSMMIESSSTCWSAHKMCWQCAEDHINEWRTDAIAAPRVSVVMAKVR